MNTSERSQPTRASIQAFSAPFTSPAKSRARNSRVPANDRSMSLIMIVRYCSAVAARLSIGGDATLGAARTPLDEANTEHRPAKTTLGAIQLEMIRLFSVACAMTLIEARVSGCFSMAPPSL